MKKVFVTFAVLLFGFGVAQAQESAVSDTQNSGCLSETRSDGWPPPVIVLKKDGSILSVELQNYVSNCATSSFNVESQLRGGSSDKPCSVTVDVSPVTSHYITTCECPFNVSFALRDLEEDCFYLSCWWYHGMVELTGSEPLVLEYLENGVEIDGIYYNLISGGNVAEVTNSPNYYGGKASIPESVSYGGVDYSVTSIRESAFADCTGLTTVSIPNTVTSIGRYAFIYCDNLTTLTIGSGIKAIMDDCFYDCQNLKDVYCYAETVPNTNSYAFLNSNTENARLHVPEASVSAYSSTSPWNQFKTILALAVPSVATGIKELKHNDNSGIQTFDLYGRRITARPQRGLYIRDGRKYVVKE